MKKKLIIIVSAISLLVTVFGLLYMVNLLGGFSKKFENFDYLVINDEVVIVAYKEQEGIFSAVIPDEIEGMPVVEVRNFGLFNTNQVKTITIGVNVKRIGEWAFTNNSGLIEFIVKEGNTDYSAVDGVLFTFDKETLLYYPAKKGVVSTRNEFNLEVLTIPSYTVPDGTKVIRKLAFYNCKLLESVILPDSIKDIEEKAFFYAEGLSNVILPEGLISIGKDAFAFCSNKSFNSVEIPSTVEYVGEYAFYNAASVEQIKVNKNYQETASWGEKWWPSANGRAMVDISFNDILLSIGDQN